jgi:hypothetical protein
MNTRIEMHGDEEKKMLDLRIEADLPNTVLDLFSASLRPALFSTDDQPELEPDAQHLPHVKNPELGVLTWGGSFKPVSFHLHTDARSSKNDVKLVDATLGKIRMRPKEGGTITFVWRIQASPANGDTDRIFNLLKHEVRATQDTSDAIHKEEDKDDE